MHLGAKASVTALIKQCLYCTVLCYEFTNLTFRGHYSYGHCEQKLLQKADAVSKSKDKAEKLKRSGLQKKHNTIQYNSSHFVSPSYCSVPFACTSFCHNTITELWRLKRHCRSIEVLEEKIAAAYSGWSEIPFCLTQDGFHSEISEDQYRIKMEKPEGRRVKKGSGQLWRRCLNFCFSCCTSKCCLFPFYFIQAVKKNNSLSADVYRTSKYKAKICFFFFACGLLGPW